MFNDVYIFSKLKGPGCDSIPTEVTEETDCSTIRVSPALLREQHPKKQSHRNKAGPQEQQLQYSWRHTHTHTSRLIPTTTNHWSVRSSVSIDPWIRKPAL